jgi:hypothetical protein
MEGVVMRALVRDVVALSALVSFVVMVGMWSVALTGHV